MKSTARLLTLILVAASAPLEAQTEIGFIEKFALAADREKVLGELVPGSEEYYFFHALHYQSTGQQEKLATMLQQWAVRFPSSEKRKVIENRSALLKYESDPQTTIAYLKDHLDLSFEDVQEVRDKIPNIPEALNQAAILPAIYQKKALNSDDLRGMDEAALQELVRNKTPLKESQRRALLSRLTRPDVPGLVPLIIDDLKSRESRGFGEFPIHSALLPDQLNELVKQVRSLSENTAFVHASLRKLSPNPDKDIEFDIEARTAWLDRVWNYAQSLPQSFNTLKAAVLYQRLLLDRTLGIYDKARFTEYLKLPRSSHYVNPTWIENRTSSKALVDRNASFAQILPGFQPIGEDEALVRDYLLNILKDEPAWEPWAAWLRESWLKAIFAEAKILNGIGDPEQWASLLSASEFQALRERVDVDFAPTNRILSNPADAVSIGVRIKNAKKLIIKTYEINTLNYYTTKKRQLNTDLTLDGLVANREETKDLDGLGPFLKVNHTFDFPDVKDKRGAWIIEFIGAGKSSRALIRKGQWSLIQELSAAGDLITVLDETKTQVSNAVAWFEGRRFDADPKSGKILIPFTASSGRKPIVLADPTGEFASLAEFEHHREQYSLNAQFYIEREQLLERKEATLAVRADLYIGNRQLPIELLTKPKLSITVETLDGISTAMEIPSPTLNAKKVFTHTFTVPDRAAAIQVALTGKVESLTQGGEKSDLSAFANIGLNGIDRTKATHDTQLSRFGNDYLFELLGKNGEPIAGQQIEFKFWRYHFHEPVTVYLRTNEKGRTNLGPLNGIRHTEAKAPNERKGAWPLKSVERTSLPVIHALEGEAISIPWTGSQDKISLLELRGGTFVREIREGISATPGFLVIQNLSPGDYSIVSHNEDPLNATIRVTAGKPQQGWLLSPARELQSNGTKPLQLTSVANEADQIVIKLANANSFTRVHVTATRFLPVSTNTGAQGLFNGLSRFNRSIPGTASPGVYPNLFAAGREIGDEYRYILDRRYARRLPGNMLARPALLLNPWEVRLADEQQQLNQELAAALQSTAGGRAAGAMAGEAIMDNNPPPPPNDDGSNIDFLAEAAAVLYNLVPDKDGVVRVARKDLMDRQHIQVYAEDLNSAVWQTMALAEVPTKFRDLRLIRNLDPAKPFTESKEVTVLKSGASLKIEDVSTSELETYDTLAGIHRLFTALNPAKELATFDWILLWPDMDAKERSAKYSEFACHELNFFLSQKDKPFFEKIVLPYIKNKKDKAFMDRYLIGDDLTGYLQAWEYSQLNMAERCLLARRIPAEAASTARHIRELWELAPPNPEKDDILFETALRGGVLASEGERSDFSVEKAKSADGPPPPPSAMPPSAPMRDYARKAQKKDRQEALMQAEAKLEEVAAMDGLAYADSESDLNIELAQEQRQRARPFYRNLGPTKIWAENNYYKLPIEDQDGGLIEVNKFWKDYAAWDGTSPFLSSNIAEASGSFTEMMLALAVLDLPFKAEKPKSTSDGGFTLTASTPLIAYHKQITLAPISKEPGSLLVSQNFFQQDDRYRMEGNERFDRYVTEEFLAGIVYGANIVVTNPASSPQKVEVLLQIPRGSLPVLGSKSTKSQRVELEPYTTKTIEYFFYFPAPADGGGKFPQYPVHVSKGKEVVGEAKPFEFYVVNKLTQFDKTSWDYISQYGSDDEVFAFLDRHNLQRLDLQRVAWRCRNSSEFFKKLVEFMSHQHVYNDAIYRYGVYYNDLPVLSEWLQHQDSFIAQLGSWLSTKVVKIDPVERRTFEHLEYYPLVNQRTLRFGAENQIANPFVLTQYRKLLDILSYKASLDAIDQLSVVYFLFLQDRAAEALDRLQTVNAESLETQLQLDYFRCYAAFYESKPEEARKIATWHAEHPVNRWKDKFVEVLAQADEIEGKSVKRATGPDLGREGQQGELAASEPAFEFKITNQIIALNWSNLKEISINYYLLDPEFSFSANPFVAQDSSQFSIIKPNRSVAQALPADKSQLDIPVPADLAKSDLLIEIRAAGQKKAQAYHANTMRVTMAENYGIVEARELQSGKPIPAAYIKVYARLHNGQVRFYKDGYTDLRGKFDYASLNTTAGPIQPPIPLNRPATGLDHPTLKPGEIGEVEKLAVLILSEGNGAEVREVSPPSD